MKPLKTLLLLCTCLFLSLPALSRARPVEVVTPQGKPIPLYRDYQALVIGVGDYDHWPKLTNAVRDAEEVAVSLKRIGFEVNLVRNPSYEVIKALLESLPYEAGAVKDRALLIYFAGHGETEKLADDSKLGYIVPKDCPVRKQDPKGFAARSISMKDIEKLALLIKSRHVLMIFDSCFSGSLFSMVKAAPTDIQEKVARPVRQFITAGTEEEEVPDRSTFKKVFQDGIKGEADYDRDGYVTGTELGMYLQKEVVNYTRGGQHPQYGKIRNPGLDKGDFVFVLPARQKAPRTPGSETATLVEEREKMEYEWALIEQKQKGLKEEEQRLAMARRPPEKTREWRDPATGMEFVLVPAGRFLLGSPPKEDGRKEGEGPQTEVEISRDFYLGKYEVTVGEFRRFIQGTGYQTEAETDGGAHVREGEDWKKKRGVTWDHPRFKQTDRHPVTCISWNDAQAFIKWINQKTGFSHRLPTEVEMEYATRAGTVTSRFWGEDPDAACGYANVRDKTGKWHFPNWRDIHNCADGFAETAPVGSFRPNPFGLYDLMGNLAEWCHSMLGAYPGQPVKDLRGATDGKNHVVRGGAWASFPASTRSAYRGLVQPDLRCEFIGFRLVRE
jgi:formylglycine-generating enzyme required for sulfatase activity